MTVNNFNELIDGLKKLGVKFVLNNGTIEFGTGVSVCDWPRTINVISCNLSAQVTYPFDIYKRDDCVLLDYVCVPYEVRTYNAFEPYKAYRLNAIKDVVRDYLISNMGVIRNDEIFNDMVRYIDNLGYQISSDDQIVADAYEDSIRHFDEVHHCYSKEELAEIKSAEEYSRRKDDGIL